MDDSRQSKNLPVFYIQTLGNTAFYFNDVKIQFNCKMSSNYIQLLLLLLFGGKEKGGGVSRSEILNNLYGEEEIKDTGNALRITAFRLRKLLSEAGIPGTKYIKIEQDIYSLELECPVRADIWEFEEMAQKANEEKNEEKKLKLLKKVCYLYEGSFLPNLMGAEWVMMKDANYQNLYFYCLREASLRLNKKKEYETILELSRRAVTYYPFEEWQLMEIDSLMHLNRYNDALRVYEDAVSNAYEDYGISPSESMLERFRSMSTQVKSTPKSLLDIFNLMEEKSPGNGPYYSAYPSFIDSFRLLSRISERNGWTGSLLMCTLEDKTRKSLTDPEKTQEAGDVLVQVFQATLRKGDLYTRFSPGQLLVLLNGTERHNTSIVTQRINIAFQNKYHSKVQIRYDIIEIAGQAKTARHLELA